MSINRKFLFDEIRGKLFPDGLQQHQVDGVEAILDESILALEDPVDRDRDGVSGRAAMVVDVATGERRVGRFGWKAQHATLLAFGADAYRNEMGITNDLFPGEIAVGVDESRMRVCDPIPDPEDVADPRTRRRGIDNFASFMRFLAPVGRGPVDEVARVGEAAFTAVGCASCHVASLSTGPHANPLLHRQIAFGYTFEDQRIILAPMARNGVEAIGSMGNDTPLAVLSNKPRLLYDYFKQLFAQVTNPPVDAIREELIMSTDQTIGPERNLMEPTPKSARVIKLKSPILRNEELEELRVLGAEGRPLDGLDRDRADEAVGAEQRRRHHGVDVLGLDPGVALVVGEGVVAEIVAGPSDLPLRGGHARDAGPDGHDDVVG